MARQKGRWSICLAGGILGMGVAWVTATFQIVHTAKDWYLLPRRQLAWTNFYLDVRSWNARQWQSHPELASDLRRAEMRQTGKSGNRPERIPGNRIPTHASHPRGGQPVPY